MTDPLAHRAAHAAYARAIDSDAPNTLSRRIAVPRGARTACAARGVAVCGMPRALPL